MRAPRSCSWRLQGELGRARLGQKKGRFPFSSKQPLSHSCALDWGHLHITSLAVQHTGSWNQDKNLALRYYFPLCYHLTHISQRTWQTIQTRRYCWLYWRADLSSAQTQDPLVQPNQWPWPTQPTGTPQGATDNTTISWRRKELWPTLLSPEGSQNRSVPSWTRWYVIQITHILFKPQNCSWWSCCLCSGSTAWDTVTCPSSRTGHPSTKSGKTGKNTTHKWEPNQLNTGLAFTKTLEMKACILKKSSRDN